MIFISAGHYLRPNGGDPGAVANGYREADLTIELRGYITKELDRLGVKYITDLDGETLQQYLGRIRPGSGSVVCEPHFNAAMNPNATGIEVLVANNASGSSKLLARDICQAGVKSCGFFNRGVKPESQSHRGRLGILNTAAGIAVLPEICFITNKADMARYQRYKCTLGLEMAWLLKKYDEMHT